MYRNIAIKSFKVIKISSLIFSTNNLICNFNQEIENYTKQIESPNAGDAYFHYRLDKNKLDDCKSDGLI
jgi:hypothetical protein